MTATDTLQEAAAGETETASLAARVLNRCRRSELCEWLLVVAFILTVPFINPYIRGDGNGYYSYIRSLVIDGDLHFENEYRRGDSAFIRMAFDDDGHVRSDLLLPNNYVRNHWAVGPSLLWAPFFLVAHGAVWFLNVLGSIIPADGYSPPYRWLCAFGTALYAFVGLLLSYDVARRLTSPLIAAMATAGIWFASSLPVYMYFLPFHVHALAAFSVALFLWYWVRTRPMRTIKQWGLWGLMGGLMAEVYYLNAIFLLIPPLEWVWGRSIGGQESRGGGRRRGTVTEVAMCGAAACVALMPHLATKWIIHGSPWDSGYTASYGDRSFFFWNSPRLWQVGFASEHGMFLWTPVLLLAVVGLVLLWGRDRFLAGTLMLTFVVFYYVVASYQNWHGQSAFGSRFFVSITPVFILGLAMFLKESENFFSRLSIAYRPLPVLSVFLAILILWNIGFMFEWGANLVPNRGPVDFAVVARNKITVVPHRAPGFILRYLTSREQVAREIEQGDLIESKDYRLQR